MVWVVQRSFLPLPLGPDFCDVPGSFPEGSDKFCVKLEIGTKRNGTFGVRDVKVVEVMEKIATADPGLTVGVGFTPDDELSNETMVFKLGPEGLWIGEVLRILKEDKDECFVGAPDAHACGA